MAIKIGFDFFKKEIITNEEKPKNLDESEMLERIIKELNLTDCSIEKRCMSYTTLVYKEYDIVRLRYSYTTKWISILLTKEDKKKYIDSPLFQMQENKRQVHWKSKLEDDNLEPYYELIKNECHFIDKQIN